ncbi:homocysteine S-methyltransferase family protein [Photobacterium sp. TY1-4]|uniref:homocysteine S-methyltransferase family protein n=1 Tax=Photobacterium sp. TY1-4 TaxID=2899122 RepID=UPI0021BEC6E7|nr:homocysteine S-methyltransferase family protein [Photobacterium sp. TY1-4]UXH99922.1 homocysteine S-methyltransferase family protein [Photobacterium sp. TY1-4]
MKKITILDGGMGRELKRIGAPFSQPLWSAQALIESPEHVRIAHQNFVDAGADIITVNSYACVPFHLGADRYQAEGAKLARDAAVIAQSVAKQAGESHGQRIRVAGSIPPAFGSYRPDLFEAEAAKAITSALFDAQKPYVDLWIAETIASLEEFEVIHSVLSQTRQDCYYAFTLADDVSEIAQLRSGQSVKHAAERVCAAGGQGIFFNCSTPEVMAQAIQDAKAVIDACGAELELGVFANNFTPIKSDHQANDTLQSMRELTPEDYLSFAKQWYALGATVIGGCCGIHPAHIEALETWRNVVEKS